MRGLGAAVAAVVLVTSTFVVGGGPASADATCQGRPVTIAGTDGDDVIDGTPGDDVIAGGAGADVIHGLGGNDVLCGDGDDDEVSGGSGDDVVVGGADRRGEEWGDGHWYYYGDRLAGGPGDDTFIGDEAGGTDPYPFGDDTVSFEEAAHAVRLRADLGTATGQGHDTLEDVTSVVLSAHDDHAVAGGDTAQVEGGPGQDVLTTADGFAPPYRRTDTGIDGVLDGEPGRTSSRHRHPAGSCSGATVRTTSRPVAGPRWRAAPGSTASSGRTAPTSSPSSVAATTRWRPAAAPTG